MIEQCQEYYLEQESLTPSSGVSLPVALQVQEKNGHYEIMSHLFPRDGTYYGPDVRATFPQSTWSQIMPQGEDEVNQYEKPLASKSRMSRLSGTGQARLPLLCQLTGGIEQVMFITSLF